MSELSSPNNARYLERHPDAVQSPELAHDIAIATHTLRSFAAQARRALILLEGGKGLEKIDPSLKIYIEARQHAEELISATGMDDMCMSYQSTPLEEADWTTKKSAINILKNSTAYTSADSEADAIETRLLTTPVATPKKPRLSFFRRAR